MAKVITGGNFHGDKVISECHGGIRVTIFIYMIKFHSTIQTCLISAHFLVLMLYYS